MTNPAPDLSRLRIDRDAPPPIRRALVRNVILAIAAICLLGIAAGFLRRGSVVPVQVVVAAASEGGSGAAAAGATSVTANGYVVARTRASVSAKLAGRLVQLRVSEGSFIRKGELIGQLENADYQAQVMQAVADLTSARADLIEAQSARDQLGREAKRVRDIHAQNPTLVSDQEVDAAESRAVQAEARARSAAARVESADASLRYARANLENTYIRAPFTGTVLRKDAEVGEVVAPSIGGGLTRGAVVTMADLSTLEVEVDVNEAYIARIGKLQPARITLDAYPDTAFRGEVRQVVPTADRQRATVQVKVSILDRDPRILPEMGARVDFLQPDTAGAPVAGAQPARIRLPSGAVRDLDGRTVVWLVREGRLEPKPVEAGPVSGGFREIRSGLSGGEQVLVAGVETPQAGMRVKVVNP
ncbi:MAG: efflux RND transporter periplasmic adaptor subunit [Gemmatimonadales bacterium]